jgi:hypothetical protein
MGRNARTFAERFGWPQVLQNILHLYTALAGRAAVH